MDVVTLAERLNHILVATEMRHHSKLNLTVVGREELAARLRDKRLANLLAVLAPDGDILQVRVARREAASGSNRLVKRCMDMPRTRVDKLWQSIDVCAKEFLQSSVFQNVSHNFVFVLERLEHLLTRNILSRFRLLCLLHNLHSVEEHLAHLLWRSDVEFHTGKFIDMLLNLLHPGCEHTGSLLQRLRIDSHPIHLHLGKHRHERHLDVPEQILGTILLEFRFQLVLQLKSDVGILGSIFVNLLRHEVAHVFLLLPLRSDKLLDVYRLIVEINLSHVVHVVTQLRLDEIVGNHSVKHFSLHLDTIVVQHLDVVLHVLSDFQNLLVFVERFENIYNLLRLLPFSRHGNIKSLFFFHAEAQTNQFSIDSLGRSGFRVKTDKLFCKE